MINVAKIAIVNESNKYLLLYRDGHPEYGNDPDLLGGIIENDETLIEAMVREADEEAGVKINHSDVRQVYEGTAYSPHGYNYSLYVGKLNHTPDITISWEHSEYEWLDRDAFLEKAKGANDTYMHMVYDVLK